MRCHGPPSAPRFSDSLGMFAVFKPVLRERLLEKVGIQNLNMIV